MPPPGLVQQQQVGLGEGELGKRDAALLAATQRVQRLQRERAADADCACVFRVGVFVCMCERVCNTARAATNSMCCQLTGSCMRRKRWAGRLGMPAPHAQGHARPLRCRCAANALLSPHPPLTAAEVAARLLLLQVGVRLGCGDAELTAVELHHCQQHGCACTHPQPYYQIR